MVAERGERSQCCDTMAGSHWHDAMTRLLVPVLPTRNSSKLFWAVSRWPSSLEALNSSTVESSRAQELKRRTMGSWDGLTVTFR